jgi:hypothetical protein
MTAMSVFICDSRLCLFWDAVFGMLTGCLMGDQAGGDDQYWSC